MSFDRSYSRQGLAALYTFTPFKIIFTSPSIQDTGDTTIMVFWYPKGMVGFFCENVDTQLLSGSIQSIVEDKRCKYLNELWRAPREKIGNKVYIYREFPAVRFSPQDKKYVVIIDKTILEYFEGKVSEEKTKKAIEYSYKKGSFVLAEFSYESINRPNFCRHGLVLLTHRQSCPLINICRFRGSSRGDDCPRFIKWDSARESYAGLYKVVADMRFRLSEFIGKEAKVSRTLLTIPYKGRPFLKVLFVDPINVLAYYYAVNFLPKKLVERMLRITFGKTLGIRLYMTSALKIEVNDKVLEEVLNDLMKDPLVSNWLEFKASLLIRAKALPEELGRAPLAPWNQLENMLCSHNNDNTRKIIEKIFNSDQTNLRRAMKFIVVHTLTHMIILGLWSYLGLLSDELSYIITPKNESFEVWIFEATSGGYGFIKYLAEHGEALYNIIVSNALHNVLQPNQCVVSADISTLSMLSSIVLTTVNNLRHVLPKQQVRRLDYIQERLERLINNISLLYSSHNVTPHNYVINRCLARIISGELREYFNKVIDKFLTTFNMFDGTLNYYFIEEGCMSGPYIQPFSVSCVIAKTVFDGVSKSSLEIPLKKSIIEWINTARSNIDISTWVLSVHDSDDLVKALKNVCDKGARIRLLLGKGVFSDENAYSSAINSLKQLFQRLGDRIEVRFYDKGQLHAKMVIIDSIAVIHGSFNLTKAALTSNIEKAQVTINPEEVKRNVEEFDKLWSEAITIKKPEDLKPKQ
jgi:HKD family nuclease